MKLICSQCHQSYDIYTLQHFCNPCKKPLLVHYDDLNPTFDQTEISSSTSMWRYRSVLPVTENTPIISLGEGLTPVMKLKRIKKKYDLPHIYLKDEGQNPTESFKARGISMAISKAKEFGVESVIIPTAGNAGGALSAYAQKAKMKATVVMPAHTPPAFRDECISFGADVILIKGMISDCGRKVNELKSELNAFDVSTLKEPYRIEGKKTMGYEIIEQFNGDLPDVILYPTGGGTGLIGIWKAFQEMKQLGLLNGPLPRMIAVQSKNCKPVVDAFFKLTASQLYGESKANGLAVPVVFGMDIILSILHESKGYAIAISDEKLLYYARELHQHENLYVAPEGGALLAALLELVNINVIGKDDRVLLLNTGSATKYQDHFNSK